MRRQRGNTEVLMLVGIVVVIVAALAWFLWPSEEADVVLYCGVDQDQSRQVADRFAGGRFVGARHAQSRRCATVDEAFNCRACCPSRSHSHVIRPRKSARLRVS